MNAVPRIVVGVDGFESSKAALRWAIHQAKADRSRGGRGDDLAYPAGLRIGLGRRHARLSG